MVKKKCSPAYELLAHVWSHSLKATSHSWERLNHSMSAALNLAINAGLIFDRDDFARFAKEFRSAYWIGSSGGERYYSTAVRTGNLSAAQAFEHWCQRPAFIADDVYPGNHDGFKHGIGRRQRERLAVGFSFPWKNHGRVVVTSFSHDGACLTACAYSEWKLNETQKVTKRFRITVTDIQADRKKRKERNSQS